MNLNNCEYSAARALLELENHFQYHYSSGCELLLELGPLGLLRGHLRRVLVRDEVEFRIDTIDTFE